MLDGDDCIAGGRGEDLVDAGSGTDSVRAADGERDRIRCGAGPDVATVDGLDRVAGCERTRRRR